MQLFWEICQDHGSKRCASALERAEASKRPLLRYQFLLQLHTRLRIDASTFGHMRVPKTVCRSEA